MGFIEPLAIEVLALPILSRSGAGALGLVATESHPVLRCLPRRLVAPVPLPVFVQIDEVAHVRQALRRRP